MGYVANDLDCNDGNAAINPSANEVCDGIDNDCDGSTDEGLTFLTFYADADDDIYGDPSTGVSSCNPIVGSVTNNGDCNDANAAINPSATEVCDGIDNDCDGSIDEGLTFLTYYVDADVDGYGAGTNRRPGRR
ncbi:MAG: putative metal-binding motif-containing protein [Bacteroidetes bacterium]|nr:putative metal-binding motif-containing protein [Bacteroidota bacterium]